MALSFQDKIRPVTTATTAAPVTSTETKPQPVAPKATGVSFAAKARPVTAPAPVPEASNPVVDFAKGIVSAPATLIARPFQALESAGQLAGTNTEELAKIKEQGDEALMKLIELRRAKIKKGEDVSHLSKTINDIMGSEDAVTKEITAQANFQPRSGGVVAEAPKDFGGVVSDVGRGIQTVALGTGAPMAGGAAFGLGSSLERQGSDVFSGAGALDAVSSTLLGMGLGKALDLVGKPLLNAAGKVVGTITPQILKDVAGQGAGAVERFMAQHEIVPAAVRPAINAIPKAAEAFDTGVNKLFSKAGNAVKTTFQSQYPGTKPESVAKHYENVEVDRLMEPAKKVDATYKKASQAAKDAERRGIDLKQVAADNKIYASENIADGKFNTADTVQALRNENMSRSGEIFRPALEAAEPGVQRVPISEVRKEILKEISAVSDAKLSPEQKLSFAKKVAKEYADNSITASRYKDGYSLTNLYDSKLNTVGDVYKAPKSGGAATISDTLTAQQKQIESKVFDKLLRKNAPKEIGLDAYFKAQEARFKLADYLESLHGKKAPQTLFQRGVKRTAQLAGATAGAQTAGPFGMFSGYQFGGIVADTFASASNPVKVAYLKSIGKTEPEIFAIMKNYVSEQEAKALSRLALPKASTIFTPPGGFGNEYAAATTDTTNTIGGMRQRTKLKDYYKK